MNRTQHSSIVSNDTGFAPLIVSIIIIIVLSLLTVGFVTLMRNNQKNALNQQLNNDAYYAAETGVNDAIQAIDHGYTSSKTQCVPVKSNQYLSNNQVSGSNDFYSCLLINPTPSSLQYSSIGLNQPTVAILSAINNSNQPTTIGSIEISWQPSPQSGSSPYVFAPFAWSQSCSNAPGPCLPAQTSWVNGANQPITGILRTALTPLRTGALPTDTSTTYTAFLYPSSGNGASNNAPAYSGATIGTNSGAVVSGNCNNSSNQPDACNVSINVSSANATAFLMSLRSIYNRTQATIQVFDDQGNLLNIRGAQTLVDSTGDSHGVLRRIQVRVPALNDIGFPSYDIQTTNKLCKDIQTYPRNQATGNTGYTNDPNCGL